MKAKNVIFPLVLLSLFFILGCNNSKPIEYDQLRTQTGYYTPIYINTNKFDNYFLLDSKYRNMKDLERLGKQLYNPYRTLNYDREIFIFDNLEVAKIYLYSQGFVISGFPELPRNELTDEQKSLIDKHLIAKYTDVEYAEKSEYFIDKTIRKHEFEILLPENEGGRKLIKYE